MRPLRSFYVIAFAAICSLIACELKPLQVEACTETDDVRALGDTADDVAIWVDRKQPAKSVVIGSNKEAGLHVYNLAGREIQFVPLGGVNNVDIRTGFLLEDASATVVAASTGSDDKDGDGVITLLRFDETSRSIVTKPLAEISTGLGRHALGVCLYRSGAGEFHLGAVGQTLYRQWRLRAQSDGSVHAELVRQLEFTFPAEACAFDDALQRLYISEEEFGLWRLAANPEHGDRMELVDSVKPKGGFTGDIEGVAVYARDDGTGYLIVSDQGDSSFRVYRRERANEFVASFRISSCSQEGVDGVTRTDGIEVTSAPMGDIWPAGLLVVQDHENTDPQAPQNFKYVSWDDIVREATRFGIKGLTR